MKHLINHFIIELCIELFFQKLSANFTCIPIYYTNVYDFYVGQKFTSIEIIGQSRSVAYPVVVHVNIIDEYVNVQDYDLNVFRIDKNDIPRLRFIP